MLKIPLLILSILSLLFSTKSQVLQITHKNINNVLKMHSSITILFHHPDCEYCNDYKIKFLNYFQTSSETVVGLMDCSIENNFCLKYEISSYPAIRVIYQSLQSQTLQPWTFIGNFDNSFKQRQEYKASQITQFLKKQPYFIIALFEEIGFPVQEKSKLKVSGYQWADRIFYLSQTRLSSTLSSFVKNKLGCWIFVNDITTKGNLNSYYCGDTYQSPTSLKDSIAKQLNKTVFKKGTQAQQQPSKNQHILDSSNYESDTILGYNQLLYMIKNYEIQLSITSNTKVSLCHYLYLWSKNCEHCTYTSDFEIVNRTIAKVYENGKSEGIHQIKKIYSYQISENKLLQEEELCKIAGIQNKKTSIKRKDKSGTFQIIPNILSICFSSGDSRNTKQNINLEISRFEQTILSRNVEKFIQQRLVSQIQIINNLSSVQDKKVKDQVSANQQL